MHKQPFRKLFRVMPWYDETSLVSRAKAYLSMGPDGGPVAPAAAEPAGPVKAKTQLDIPAPPTSSATAMGQTGRSESIGKQVNRVQNSFNRYPGNVFQRPAMAESEVAMNAGAKYLTPSPYVYQDPNDFIRQFGYARIRR